MKKVYLFIGLMLSALAIGCNGTDVDQQPVQGGSNKETVTVNATLPSDFVWAAGDKVAINGLESEAVSEEGAGSASYAFVTSKTTTPVVVVSPYEILTGKGEVTLPATQDYVVDGVDRSAYGLAGIAAELVADPENEKKFTADVNLNPVMGIVSLPLTLDSATAENPVAIKQVSFTALNNAAINGTWTAEAVTATDEYGVSYYDIKMSVVKGSSTINLACGEGVAIDTVAPVYFNIAVPAATYTGGFEVVLTDAADHNYILTLTEDVVVERGVVAELAPSAFTVIEKAPATLTVTIAQEGIAWQEGDAIVCNNSLSSNTVTGAVVGTQTAEFAFDAVAYPYSVFYPAEYYTTSGSLRFYDAQPLIKDGYDRKNMVMVGYSNTTEVTLNNLCGIVTIPVTNKYEGETIIIDKVEVATAEGDAIAGKYHINYRTGELTLTSGKSSIVLTPEAEGAFAIEPEATANISFVVPRGSIRNGLKLNIYSSVGLIENHKIFPTGLSVRGGETSTADLYEFKEVKIEKIMTAEELLDFSKCVNMGRYKKYVNEEGKVVLGGDIDMSTLAEWVPVTGAIDAATGLPTGFDGKFDGCGYSIKNWATAQPLFGYLAATGSVSNLVIDQSCGLTIPAVLPYTISGAAGADTCFGFVVATNFGVVENITNNAEVTTLCADDTIATSRAAIVGFNAIGGYVKGCINNAAITYDLGNHSSGTGYLGTVVGRAQSAAETVPAGIYNCENHGKFTVNILDDKTTKNFYIGGVTGSSNSYTVTSGCKNTGDITWNCPYSGAAVVMGGVTSYSAGKIENCHNEGNILFNNTGNIKGTCIGGIVCYQNGEITGCTNKGNITAYGKKFEGRNTIGSISTDKASSSPAPTFAGIMAYGYNSEGSPFSMSDCINYGKIAYYWTKVDEAGTSGRTQVAGVAGAPWGDVVNCHNYGDIEFVAKYETATANHLSYIGGVVASDYYAKSQSESSVIDCTNEGNIIIDCDAGTSNNAAGGIIGWPGAESNCTNVTQNCVNKGDIVFSGEGKFRLGGIQGGSGIIIDCVNEGNITINSSNSGSMYGGLAGFHSGNYELSGSTTTGDIVCNVPVSAGGVAGMAGNLGNAAHAEGKIRNNTINCLVKAQEGTCGVGMAVGHFNGKTKTIYLGSAAEPLKIAGTLQIGDVATVVDATNVTTPAILGGNCSNFDATMHIYNCVLAE